MKLDFRQLEEENFVHLDKWSKNAHVQKTWGNSTYSELYEKCIYRINSNEYKQFIIYYQENPIGYIQYYWASRVGDGWWINYPDDVVGFDFYIGETDFLNKGFGKLIIFQFTEYLFSLPQVKKVIADPSPQNSKISYLLEKCGFTGLGDVVTPDGPAKLYQAERTTWTKSVEPILSKLKGSVVIRELDPNSNQEIKLVADRMQKTLVDVLGEEKGLSMYTIDWLENRVKFHIELGDKAKIYLAENSDKHIIGHAIVRHELDDKKSDYGYFSTIYVLPEFRGQGIATALVKQVENWCKEKQFEKIIYNTAEDNDRLIRLYKNFGFSITHRESEMVQLTKFMNLNS